MSVVAAQNRRALLSYTLGEIKTLLAELLGLGQIRQPGDKASQIVRLIRTAPDERRRSRAEACGMGSYGRGVARGALDSERKRMFMQMKRKVLRVGGYARKFFVSQTLELAQMADVVIELSEVAKSQAGVTTTLAAEV